MRQGSSHLRAVVGKKQMCLELGEGAGAWLSCMGRKLVHGLRNLGEG